MTVTTGMRSNSGTASAISFILAGDIGDTGVRTLTDGKRKVNKLRCFMMPNQCLEHINFSLANKLV